MRRLPAGVVLVIGLITGALVTTAGAASAEAQVVVTRQVLSQPVTPTHSGGTVQPDDIDWWW